MGDIHFALAEAPEQGFSKSVMHKHDPSASSKCKFLYMAPCSNLAFILLTSLIPTCCLGSAYMPQGGLFNHPHPHFIWLRCLLM